MHADHRTGSAYPGENLDIDFGKPDVAAWGQLEISADGKEWQKVDFQTGKRTASP